MKLSTWAFDSIGILTRRSGQLILLLALAGSSLLAADKVQLKPKFTPGESEITETKVTFNQVLTLAGNPIKTGAENVVAIRSETAKEKKENLLAVKNSITSFKSQLSIPNGVLKFDSAKPNEAEVPPGLDFLKEAFQSMAKLSFTSWVDPANNQVARVEVDRSALNDLSPMAQSVIQDQLKEENLKLTMNQELTKFPQEPVGVGDSWKRTEVVHLGTGQTFTFETEYSYAGVVQNQGKALHRITGKSTSVKFVMDPNSPSPLKVDKSDLKVVESAAEVLFDLEAGRTVKSTNKALIQGDMTFNIQGTETPGKLELRMENVSEHK